MAHPLVNDDTMRYCRSTVSWNCVVAVVHLAAILQSGDRLSVTRLGPHAGRCHFAPSSHRKWDINETRQIADHPTTRRRASREDGLTFRHYGPTMISSILTARARALQLFELSPKVAYGRRTYQHQPSPINGVRCVIFHHRRTVRQRSHVRHGITYRIYHDIYSF